MVEVLLEVELDYFNDSEKLSLSNFPYDQVHTVDRVSHYQAKSSIRKADFLSFYLIHRCHLDGHKTFRARLGLASTVIGYMNPVITLRNRTIQSVAHGPAPGDFAERIGEAVGLGVLSRMFQLTEADWTVLRTFPGKWGVPTFDFEIASDCQRVIQLEAKGSVVADNSEKSIRAVSRQATKIKKKKTKIMGLGLASQPDPYPALLRYGAITVIDRAHNAKCLLLDPPEVPLGIDPRKLRLLKRLTFVANMVRMLAPNATLADAIDARVAQVLESDRPLAEWDGLPLRYVGGGGFFSSQNYVKTFLSRGKLYAGGIVGAIYEVERAQLLFFGFREEPINLAIEQDFNGLLQMQFDSSESDTTAIVEADNQRPFSGLHASGMQFELLTSSSGVVFGLDTYRAIDR